MIFISLHKILHDMIFESTVNNYPCEYVQSVAQFSVKKSFFFIIILFIFIYFCCVSGAHLQFVYPERRVCAVARLAGPGAPGRVGAPRARRGAHAGGGVQPPEAPSPRPLQAQGVRGEIQTGPRDTGTGV